jgi:phosphoglycolate phosphatase
LKLVIFDCDGTLIDSQHNIVWSMQRAFETEGLAWPGRAATLGIVGLSLREAMKALVPDGHDRVHERLADAYKSAFSGLRSSGAHEEPLYEGGREVLDSLRARDDVLLAVATGKSRRGVNVLIETEGLHDHFQSIQTADTAPSKPHPAMVHQAIAETGVRVDRTVMVGDTSYDMAMARSAGVGAIGVAWGYHGSDQLNAAGAHCIVDHFNDLEESLETYWRAADA